jgi:hypothetical protein
VSRAFRHGYPLTREELQIAVARADRRLARTRRALLSLAGAGLAVVVVLMALALPPNISAALGHGVRGTYVPQTQVLVGGGRGSYVWSGTFTSDSGQVETNVDYFDHLPAGTGAGSSFPAIYQDRQAFLVRGSRAWIGVLTFLVLSAAGLSAILWVGPIQALRRRTRSHRPAHAATGHVTHGPYTP